MALNRVKQFSVKNGEWPGSIAAHQSGYSGGHPARINDAGELERAYADTGYVGIYAKGSDVDKSGAPVTFYAGPGIFTLEKGAGETAYPFDEDLTYVNGNSVGITVAGGEWSNSASIISKRGTVMGVGTVSGGKVQSLTILFI
jgi:hypothetical protein